METAVNIATLISGAMDIVLFAIAIYTFYLNFISKKIKCVSYGESLNTWQSDSINIVLKNKTLQSIIISKIHIILDEKYRVKIREYHDLVMIKPFASLIVNMEPYTNVAGLTNYEFSQLCSNTKKRCIEITTDENKKIYIDILGETNTKNSNKWESLTLYSKIIDGEVIRDDYAYIIYYWVGDTVQVQRAYINKYGMISTGILGFNAIPQDIIDDKDKVIKILTEPCKKLNIKMNITKISELG